MDNSLVPPQVESRIAENAERVRGSGESIDQAFISRGYVGVAAEIDYRNRTYGPGTYEADLAVQSSDQAFAEFRRREGEVEASIDLARNASPAQKADLWNEIIQSPMPSTLKDKALWWIDPDRHARLVEEHLNPVREALRIELNNVCKFQAEPAIPLFAKPTVDLRKSIVNEVMLDAYGPLGFHAFRRRKGVDSLMKKLGHNYAIVVEPDIHSLETAYPITNRSPGSIWPLKTYDALCYLGPAKAKIEKLLYFNFNVTCVASWRPSRYEDTRSLESMIRARALWYELTVAPIESVLSELH